MTTLIYIEHTFACFYCLLGFPYLQRFLTLRAMRSNLPINDSLYPQSKMASDAIGIEKDIQSTAFPGNSSGIDTPGALLYLQKKVLCIV
jgi:hypothetical protein